MKVLLDLNVLLDVVQNRVPHYHDSASVLSLARLGEIQAALPVHAFTTLYYILAKAAGKPKAGQTIDWLLAHFEVAIADRAVLRRARQLPLADFEDAVVASLAEAGQCDHIITRNVPDFAGSPVPALTPTDFLITRS
jgi:predicted nucleic acid-binding protein